MWPRVLWSEPLQGWRERFYTGKLSGNKWRWIYGPQTDVVVVVMFFQLTDCEEGYLSWVAAFQDCFQTLCFLFE